jgi:VWFA-related protein
MLVLASLPAASHAQQPASSQPSPVLKAPAHDVVLPVTVRNKKGELVTSVKVNDLTLSEDSRPQKITSFTRKTGLPFRLGLLVDTSRSMTGAMESERKAVGKFVDNLLPELPSDRPNARTDQIFLIHFDREVELLCDFTTSRDSLHHELNEMGPSRAAQNESRNSDSGGNNNGGNGGYGGGRGQGQGQGQARGRRSSTQLYDAIYLASDEVMKKQEGRKALVVFSDGVDQGSKMTLNDAVDAADKAGLAVYTIYLIGEEERPAGAGIPGMGGGHLGGMGGGGYPGGVGVGWPGGGGRGGGGQREPQVDGKKIMEKIAARTGGHCYEAKKKDNLEEIYGQIAEELRGQFLLTYTPDQVDKEGGFHKIVLKASKDDLTVVTREGYYAPADK